MLFFFFGCCFVGPKLVTERGFFCIFFVYSRRDVRNHRKNGKRRTRRRCKRSSAGGVEKTWHVRLELLEITRLSIGRSSRIAGTMYESANFQNHQHILLWMCSLAKMTSIFTSKWCQGKSRRTECQIRLFGLVVFWPPEGKTIIGNNRTNFACTLNFARPHKFSDLNDTLRRFWKIHTLGIHENMVLERCLEKRRLHWTRLAFHFIMMGKVTKLPHLRKQIVQCCQTTMRWRTESA